MKNKTPGCPEYTWLFYINLTTGQAPNACPDSVKQFSTKLKINKPY